MYVQYVNRDFLKGVLVGFVLALFACYSFFRLYWILEIGIKYFRWHAILWLYVMLLLLFAAFSYMLYKTGRLKKPAIQHAYLITAGLIAGLHLAEGYFRLSGKHTSYLEHREGVFVNPAERVEKGWYMTWHPNETIALSSGNEYRYLRQTNSEGLSDKEWSTVKDSNEVRIITLGDSFTEGDGAALDSSYPSQLKGMLQKQFPDVKINVMNAGRCGSDPWFEYVKLRDRLLKYKPDIVVYTNGSNDLLFDHLIYGGMERFAPDSTVKNKYVTHKWLWLYEISHLFRALADVAGYDPTLFGIGDRMQNEKSCITDALQLAEMYDRLAKENHFTCIELIRPDKGEMEEGKYLFNIQQLLTGYKPTANFSRLDLLRFYHTQLAINKDNLNSYFWHTDAHHNAKGYNAMAKAVYSVTEPVVKAKIVTGL